MQRAVELIRDWCAGREIEGATVTVHELDGRTPVIVVEVPAFGGATGGRHRRPLRASRQATGDARLARRARPVDPGDRRRSPLRQRRRRRRLRGVRQPRRDRGRARRRRRPRPLRRADRGQRGVGIARSAGTRRGARRPHRHAELRRLSRLGLHRLRPDVAHDVAARGRQPHAVGRHRARGAALGGVGHDPVDVPHRPHAAVAHRGRSDRAGAARHVRRQRSPTTASPRPRPPPRRSAPSPTAIRSSTGRSR